MTNKVHLPPTCCSDYKLDALQSTAPPLTGFGDEWSLSFNDTVRTRQTLLTERHREFGIVLDWI